MPTHYAAASTANMERDRSSSSPDVRRNQGCGADGSSLLIVNAVADDCTPTGTARDTRT